MGSVTLEALGLAGVSVASLSALLFRTSLAEVAALGLQSIALSGESVVVRTLMIQRALSEAERALAWKRWVAYGSSLGAVGTAVIRILGAPWSARWGRAFVGLSTRHFGATRGEVAHKLQIIRTHG